MKSINDLQAAPYCKLIASSNITLKPELICNLVQDVKLNSIPLIQPTFARYGNEIYIKGGTFDILAGTAFFLRHPNLEYSVDEYEDLEVGEDRFEKQHGMNTTEYLSHAAKEDMNFSAKSLEEGFISKQSNIAGILKKWISAYTPAENKAPLLIGHSGISKSAIVKEIVKQLDKGSKWGYRLVDIRAAFLDKVDLMGIITVEPLNGQDVWADAPKSDFLTCTTSFITECRDWITKNTKDEHNAQVFDKISELAKTPVIFWDEINRAPKYIQNQVMVIINQHRLNSYDLSLCPNIAAANVPIDMDQVDENDLELIQYVLKDEVTDKAIIDRYIPLEVKGSDPSVNSAGYLYLADKYKNSPIFSKLISSLYNSGQGLLHDISLIDSTGKFPTFRGWDFVGQYIESCEKKGETPNLEICESLVGKSGPLQSIFKKNGINPPENYTTTKFTQDCIRHNLPVMLLGKMGIGKTAKIMKATSDEGCIVETVDLSSRDRCDVLGFPNKYPLSKFIFKDNPELLESAAFKSFEAQLIKNNDVPKQTTGFVGNRSLAARIDEARKSGKKLVLVFDELNRASPIVQSAVFEAISDKRFMGVPLDGIDFTVVAAGNYNDPNGSSNFEVTPIDTATLHRFASKIITEISDDDLNEFREYVKKNMPTIYTAMNFDTMTNDRLAEYLNTSSDDDNIETGAAWAHPSFSMRTFQSLDKIISVYDVVRTMDIDFLSESSAVLKLLESDKYVITALQGGSEISFETQAAIDIYGTTEMSVNDYIRKTHELLSDPKLNHNDMLMIMATLQHFETLAFDEIHTALNGAVPKSLREVIQSQVSIFYENMSRAHVNSEIISTDMTEDMSESELEKALQQLMKTCDPSQFDKILVESIAIYSHVVGGVDVKFVEKIIKVAATLTPTPIATTDFITAGVKFKSSSAVELTLKEILADYEKYKFISDLIIASSRWSDPKRLLLDGEKIDLIEFSCGNLQIGQVKDYRTSGVASQYIYNPHIISLSYSTIQHGVKDLSNYYFDSSVFSLKESTNSQVIFSIDISGLIYNITCKYTKSVPENIGILKKDTYLLAGCYETIQALSPDVRDSIPESIITPNEMNAKNGKLIAVSTFDMPQASEKATDLRAVYKVLFSKFSQIEKTCSN